MKKKFSIVQTEQECYFCGSQINLHWHHIFGGSNRNRSEKDGLTCWVCMNHHTGDEGLHTMRPEMNRYLKRIAQKAWEERYGDRNKFIREYNKSAL